MYPFFYLFLPLYSGEYFKAVFRDSLVFHFLSSITLLYGCIIVYSTSPQLMDIWAYSNFLIIQIIMQLVMWCISVYILLMYLWERILETGLINPRVSHMQFSLITLSIPALGLDPFAFPPTVCVSTLPHSPSSSECCEAFTFCQSNMCRKASQCIFNMLFSYVKQDLIFLTIAFH